MRRILVLRGGALGDLIVTLPALALLSQRWPGAHITLVGNTTAGNLALKRGLISELLSQHEGRWAALHGTEPLPASLGAWLAAFDLVVNFCPDPDGALRRVDYAISAFWLLPRATIARVGLFDERFAYAPEDADYCIRIWAAGLEVLQDGSVVAIHDAREASRRLRPRLALRHVAGLAALFRKHRYLFGTARLYRRLGMTGPT